MKRILKKMLRGNPLLKKLDLSCERDFSFTSGERQISEKLEEIRFDHRARYNIAIDFLNQYCSEKEKMFGLDLFSANGYGTYMLSNQVSCHMLGIEGSGEAVAFANKHYSIDKIYYAQKIFSFELPLGVFDFITCFESLEHVKDSSAMIEQLYSSLKKGGHLFLSTPNEECLPYSKKTHPFHFRHYTRKELLEIIKGKTDLKLLRWYGQNLYKIEKEQIMGPLSDEEMCLNEKEEGQLLIYVFHKPATASERINYT